MVDSNILSNYYTVWGLAPTSYSFYKSYNNNKEAHFKILVGRED